MVRILLSSLAAALILLGATSLAPDPEARLPIPAPAASRNAEVRSLPGAYAALPRAVACRTSIIDHCFISDADANVPASPGQLALVVAALKQDWKTVLRMLDAGGSVETADDTGVTPLMAAAMQGDVGILRSLLERHARVDSTDLTGRSALHYAVTAGKLEAVQLLLPRVSNLETISGAGNDLLTMALETGDTKIFQTILERLPATLQWTANTRRALETALRAEMKEQVRLLLSKHPAPPTREDGTVPLIAYAIASDDAALFHTLLACGSDPNIVIPKAAEKEFMSLLKSRYLRLYIQE
jgi:ankyrin repeat protein